MCHQILANPQTTGGNTWKDEVVSSRDLEEKARARKRVGDTRPQTPRLRSPAPNMAAGRGRGGVKRAARIVTQARSVLGAQALSAATRRFPVPPPSFSSTRWRSGLVAAVLGIRARWGSGGRLWGAAGVRVAEEVARNPSARPGFRRTAGSAQLGAWRRGSERDRAPECEPAFGRGSCVPRQPKLSHRAWGRGWSSWTNPLMENWYEVYRFFSVPCCVPVDLESLSFLPLRGFFLPFSPSFYLPYLIYP